MITNRQIPAKVAARQEFKANSTRAERSSLYGGYGIAYHLTAEQKAEIDASSYVVYSYATPIAWLLADGSLFLDDHKYSVTTSRAQGLVRRAMTEAEFTAHKQRNPEVWK